MNTTSVTRNRIVRFSSSGYVESFNPNVNSFVSALAVQNDGKVIIGGYFFSAIGSVSVNRLGRVSTT
ncbi:hypothetical protein KBC03_07320 [Patescibacteria group bacterium]|nr:hypothetical protein [Patescibacteria group bacterium]